MAVGRRRSGPGDGGAVELARRLGVLLSELGLSEIDVTVGGVRVRLQRGGGSAAPPAAALAFGWREGRRQERADGGRTVVFASTRAREAHAVAEEAVRLYATGQFARACERFSHAAADEPTGPRRQDVVRCFEGWGWHV